MNRLLAEAALQRTLDVDLAEIAGGGDSMRYEFPLGEHETNILNDPLADYLVEILAG